MEYALNIILSIIILLNIIDLLNNYSETQLSEQVILYQFKGYWLFYNSRESQLQWNLKQNKLLL